MTMGRGYCWMNGELIPQAEAALSVSTDAVLRGASVFEGIRAYRLADGARRGDRADGARRGGDTASNELALFRVADHLDRLFQTSMRFLRMRLDHGPDDLSRAMCTLVAANEISTDAYLRVVVYIGEHGLGGGSEIPAGAFILATEGFNPAPASMRVTLSPWRRMSDVAMPPRVKASANYLNSRIATADAQRKGFDTAVLLNERGQVAEGPAMNIFLVRDGQLVTPRVTDGILEGITRATVIDLAHDLGIPVVERAIDATELYVAQEMFLCGTAYEIAPVREIDGYDLGDGETGPITGRLRDAYFEVARGMREVRAGWLTPAADATTPDDARPTPVR
jgi:branched-chain amino acid aminotransferase